ncbi:hypothetical protein CEXT_726641 [Caerostris extrusa]|uniref:Uncharacterized protein n=1 Tax=Caerostris extrusa TaxID=172846 RepID=A0AAV4XE43_CAEEX|nr:hypothetical protein CEXT_726641 [Caerostris extrusa]
MHLLFYNLQQQFSIHSTLCVATSTHIFAERHPEKKINGFLYGFSDIADCDRKYSMLQHRYQKRKLLLQTQSQRKLRRLHFRSITKAVSGIVGCIE